MSAKERHTSRLRPVPPTCQRRPRETAHIESGRYAPCADASPMGDHRRRTHPPPVRYRSAAAASSDSLVGAVLFAAIGGGRRRSRRSVFVRKLDGGLGAVSVRDDPYRAVFGFEERPDRASAGTAFVRRGL